MNCPLDAAILEPHVIDAVTVEECPKCRGSWLSEDQLRKAKDAAEPDLNWLDFDLWSAKDEFHATWSSRKCPQCQRQLAIIGYGKTGVSVDYCPDGHGLWLDKGELDAIIARLDAEANSKTVSEYVTASLGEAKEIVTGGEGFASEWKDFASIVRLLEYRILSEHPTLASLISALQSSSPLR